MEEKWILNLLTIVVSNQLQAYTERHVREESTHDYLCTLNKIK